MRFARLFIDAPDRRIVRKKGDIRNLMNLHNNEAGRRVSALIKKKRKFSSYIRKFRVEQLQSHI
jgi:hypothetical protein